MVSPDSNSDEQRRPLRIAITIGSTRPGTVGKDVAQWAYDIARLRNDATFELLNIGDFDPLPSMSPYRRCSWIKANPLPIT